MPRQVTASHNESHFSLDGNHRQSQSDSSSSSRHTRPIARYKNQSQWDLRGWEDGEPERRPPTPQNRGPPSGLSARRDQRDVSPCRAAPASNAHNAASVSSLASALQARGEGGGNAKAASFTPHCHPTTMTHAMNAACERHGGAASNGPARPQNAYAQQEPTVFDDDASWDAGMPRRPPGRGFPSEAVRGDEGQYRRPVSPQPSQQMPPRLNFNFSQPNFRPPSPQQQRHASPQPQQQRQQPGSRQAEVDDRRQQQPQQQPQQQQQQQQQPALQGRVLTQPPLQHLQPDQQGLPRGGIAGHWNVGDPCRYFSRRQGTSLSCKILSVDPSSGAVEISVKPGYWMPLDEHQSVLSRES